jgi:hypothetical protein
MDFEASRTRYNCLQSMYTQSLVKDVGLYLHCMLYRIFLVYHCTVLLKVIASAIANYDSFVFVPI